jgi:hypothetical protein
MSLWTHANLETQGYCLTREQSRELRVGLRFPTALCLGLVVTALVLQSAALLFGLSAIGAVAGFTSRHPFDHLWNRAIRHLLRAPELPPNPRRRRHAFKIAAAWLLLVAVLFAAGATTAGLVLGAALVAACSVVTVANFCIPSELMALWDRLSSRRLEPTP